MRLAADITQQLHILQGQTCGELSRFYEHVANEMFCASALPPIRKVCCSGESTTTTTELEIESSTVGPVLKWRFQLVLTAFLVGGAHF